MGVWEKLWATDQLEDYPDLSGFRDDHLPGDQARCLVDFLPVRVAPHYTDELVPCAETMGPGGDPGYSEGAVRIGHGEVGVPKAKN